MVVLLHGAAGGWDEVAIAVAALAVLWIAVKLAGRKSANGDEDEDEEEQAEVTAPRGDQQDPEPSSPTTRG
jgi:hypothetical protein